MSNACAAGPARWQLHDWPVESMRAGTPRGVVGVDVNSRGEVLLLHRAGRIWNRDTPLVPIAEPTLLVLDGATGRALHRWGANRFVMPHGITVDAQGNVWVTDVALHQVFKFSARGELLLVVGEAGVAGSDGSHFDGPTDVAVMRDGSFYVADGYGNARIARFSAEGRFLFQWGRRGSGQGEFNLPHAIALGADGSVYVADRENARIQLFDSGGRFRAQWPTTPIEKPFGVAILGTRVVVAGDPPENAPGPPVRLATFAANGRLVSVIHAAGVPRPGGDDVAVSRDGGIYVAGPWPHGVEKFVRAPPG